ncbi:hypothetical protein K458DRAFT_425499 [Lentithecium fluviatile CBS 122367]|uniref:Uncharacterized protein n=1 Tax=Lentithecium fluviatile CBS 122367 TaxID=1168545 RepID=A0A6G1JMU7_9PLEO|nr:hypothetical protein K458DRAFT_425499 [Lentithecium fluviatile CBS 122367]
MPRLNDDEIGQMVRYVLELVNTDGQTYTIQVEELEQDVPEVVIMSICDTRAFCFHVAITWSIPDIENAKAVCSQAVLYRSTDNDPLLYFAVYDRHTQTLYFCLLDPAQQTYEDMIHYSTQHQDGEAATRLQTYVASNAEALRRM